MHSNSGKFIMPFSFIVILLVVVLIVILFVADLRDKALQAKAELDAQQEQFNDSIMSYPASYLVSYPVTE